MPLRRRPSGGAKAPEAAVQLPRRPSVNPKVVVPAALPLVPVVDPAGSADKVDASKASSSAACAGK